MIAQSNTPSGSHTHSAGKPWPPPPDLASIQELVATADVDSFIAEGSPADEYEIEADSLFQQIENFATADLVAARLLPILEDIWQSSFQLSPADLTDRRPGLRGLAGQIERFFGPAAQPQVRGA